MRKGTELVTSLKASVQPELGAASCVSKRSRPTCPQVAKALSPRPSPLSTVHSPEVTTLGLQEHTERGDLSDRASQISVPDRTCHLE